MLKYLRYTLAALCLAACVGCLLLWWRSSFHKDTLIGGLVTQDELLGFQSSTGRGSVHLIPARFAPTLSWRYRQDAVHSWDRVSTEQFVRSHGYFAVTPYDDDGAEVYFPLWYPALIIAAAGLGIMRVGKRFTVRSAIIATTIVAALLGMMVVL